MECRELTERTIDVLTGEADESARRELERHLETCLSCRSEKARLEATWQALGEDPETSPTPEFERRTLALLEDEMIRRRVRAFRPRPRWVRSLSYAAGLALAALGGAWAARYAGAPAAPAGTTAPGSAAAPPVEAGSHLANVSYTPPDAQGRIGVSFDLESRKTVVGRPDDPQMARLLAYLVSRTAQTSGQKAEAIEQVSSHYSSRSAPASPEIVRALSATLRKDPNPGVRKKAADALAAFPITPEIRTAFLEALGGDRNPAVRLVAVEALAASAKESPDERTIESLRAKAFDPAENGFVRARAASALKAMEF